MRRILPATATILTGIYLLGIATNVWPALRGPGEWRWPYVIPGEPARAWLSAVVLLVYLGVVYRLQPGDDESSESVSGGRRLVWLLLAAGVMTLLLQLALLALDHPALGVYQLFYRTVSELSGGFFNVGAPVTDIRSFLAEFAARMPTYPVHPQRHPPGLPLLFAVARGFFDAHPALGHAIASFLRPSQCQNLGLMQLPDGAIAAATLQMVVPALLALVVPPLYWLGRAVYGEAVGRRAALLWPLVPSVALWATRWNQLYGLFTLLALLFIHRAVTRGKLAAFFFSGLAIGLSSFFSLGNVVIGLFVGLFGLFLWLDADGRLPLGNLAAGAAAFVVGLALVWLAAAAYGVNFFAVWREAMGTHLSLGRSYLIWLFYHPYDFFVFLGIPLGVYWAARSWRMLRRWRERPRDLFALSFLVGLAIVVLSGTSQGEVARVWAFLMPPALLIAVPRREPGDCRRRPGPRAEFMLIAGLLAAQLFTSNLFLRPVSTGLLDPPAPPPSVDATGEVARWQDGPTLLAVSFPQHVDRHSALAVELIWGASSRPTRAYTAFIHMVGADGTLVAQDDGLPLNGAWLTTCWAPGAAFSDVPLIAIPDDLPPGEYRLKAGLYWLPGLARLPLTAGGDMADDVVDLGPIWVDP